MNVQNAKELSITEGDVRTIHDSDGRQLWGRLAYDVKYEGNTTQQTFSGKNLFYGKPGGSSSGGITATWNGNTVVFSGEATSSYSNITASNYITFPAGTYTFSMNQSSSSFSSVLRFNYGGTNHDYSIAKNSTSVTFTLPETGTLRIVYIGGLASGAEISGTYSYQLEAGSTPTSIEPYVGGTPSPNPDYPQTVNVVTGAQTITLTDGVVSDDFTLALGTTELCKIGDKQDYIYKSGDDWYVHKEVYKITADGTQSITLHNTRNGVAGFRLPVPFDAKADSMVLSDKFYYVAWETYQSNTERTMGRTTASNTDYGVIYVTAPNSLITNANEMITWFSNNNSLFYYVLATPTDTQITDTTLIEQLSNIDAWVTRYGYTSSVTGNLPIIINQTTLS